MKAKTPDASMLMMESAEDTEEVEMKPTIPDGLIETYQTNEALQNLIPNLNELLATASESRAPELYSIKRAPEINSIQDKCPLNYFEVTNSNAKPLDIETEQKKDPVLQKVFAWIAKGCTDDLTYASLEVIKYCKHFTHLQIQKGILVRQFFDDVGQVSHIQ